MEYMALSSLSSSSTSGKDAYRHNGLRSTPGQTIR
jgi:hypothetical protein